MIVEHASSTHMQKLERNVEGEALEEEIKDFCTHFHFLLSSCMSFSGKDQFN